MPQQDDPDVYPQLASIGVFLYHTDNPLYTDTRYNDKNCYNDNLIVMKPSLKRKQLVTRMLYLVL